MADSDDNFMSGMKDLLGMDKDQVEDILEKLDSDGLLALQDAITNDDKEAAEEAIKSATVDEEEDDGSDKINALFRPAGSHDAPKKKKKFGSKIGPNVTYQVGDDVLVGDEELSGTVQLPSASHGLIGVRVKGKLKMFKPKDVKLDEGVMGMSPMFSLSRMQALAGISGQAPTEMAPPAMAADTVEFDPEQTVEVEYEDDPSAENQTPLQIAMRNLDQLEAALPNVTLAELKDVKARIYALTTSINESVNFGRKLKR